MSLTFFFFILMLMYFFTSFIFLLSKKKKNLHETTSPYECGFDPFCPTRIPFSLRFFLIAILFLIFDVEISLILPIPFSVLSNFLSIFFFILFIFILLIGLIYEWNLGSLDWAK